MSLTPPSCEDTTIWDAWLAAYQMPALAAADEVGLFDAVDQAPADAGELAGRLGLKVEALRALLPMMAAGTEWLFMKAVIPAAISGGIWPLSQASRGRGPSSLSGFVLRPLSEAAKRRVHSSSRCRLKAWPQ